MNVTQYLFQSPSPNQVQIGRVDPSSKQEEETTTTSQAPQMSAVKAKTAGEFLSPVESATNLVAPTVSQNHLLDVYA